MIHRMFATKADRIDEAAELALKNRLIADATLLNAVLDAAPQDASDNRYGALLREAPEAFVTLAQLSAGVRERVST